MNIGKIIKIHEDVPEPIVVPEWPKKKPEKPIPVPDWPTKKPAKVPEKVESA